MERRLEDAREEAAGARGRAEAAEARLAQHAALDGERASAAAERRSLSDDLLQAACRQ